MEKCMIMIAEFMLIMVGTYCFLTLLFLFIGKEVSK